MIKLVLIVALSGAAFLLIRGKGSPLSLLMQRALALAAIVLGIIGVAFPDLVTTVAQQLGVGRGADLVLYLLCVAFIFVTITLSIRLSAVQERTVMLARTLALLEAELHDRTASELTEPKQGDTVSG